MIGKKGPFPKSHVSILFDTVILNKKAMVLSRNKHITWNMKKTSPETWHKDIHHMSREDSWSMYCKMVEFGSVLGGSSQDLVQWLGSLRFISHIKFGHLEGEQIYLGDICTMLMNHLRLSWGPILLTCQLFKNSFCSTVRPRLE